MMFQTKNRISRIVFLLFLTQSAFVFGQVPDAEMEILKNKWRVDLREKGHELALKSSNEGMSEFSDSIRRLFLEDTFVVENLYRKQLDKDITNLGMNKAALACASEYELLIDNYYAALLSKMKPDDKELLVSWQNDWKKLMEKERTLIGKLMQEEYSGGGSIQSLTYTSRLLQAQREHTFQLIDYLTHLI
jgi:hypothetical protein